MENSGDFDGYLKALQKAQILLQKNISNKMRTVSSSDLDSQPDQTIVNIHSDDDVLQGDLLVLYQKLSKRNKIYETVKQNFPNSGSRDLVEDLGRWIEKQEMMEKVIKEFSRLAGIKARNHNELLKYLTEGEK